MDVKFSLTMLDSNGVSVDTEANSSIYFNEDKAAFLKTVARLLGLISEDGDVLFINPDELSDHDEVFDKEFHEDFVEEFDPEEDV